MNEVEGGEGRGGLGIEMRERPEEEPKMNINKDMELPTRIL